MPALTSSFLCLVVACIPYGVQIRHCCGCTVYPSEQQSARLYGRDIAEGREVANQQHVALK